MLQGFSDITGHTGNHLYNKFSELLSGRSGIRVPSGAPQITLKAFVFNGFRLFCFLLWLTICRQAGSQVLLRQARVRCRMSFACAVSCSVVSPVGIPFSSTISEYSAILCLRFSALICLYFQHSTLHGFFSLVYKRNCKTNSVPYAIIRHTKNSQRRKHGCTIFFVGSRAEKT